MKLNVARKFMLKMWGEDQGYAHLADKPAPEAEGRHGFRPFAVRWPHDAAQVWSWLEDRTPTHGMYWSPVIREGESHSSAPAAGGFRVLWGEADMSDPPILSSALWAPWRVQSGTPGHWHPYQELDELVSREAWEWQAERLKGSAWWGTDSKPDSSRFVRIPGTWHRKVKYDHTAAGLSDTSWWRPVRLVHPVGAPIGWDAVERAVTAHGVERAVRPVKARQRPVQGVSRAVRAMLDTDDPPRAHRVIWRVARTLLEEQRSVEEVVAIVDGSPIHEAKLSDNPAYNLAGDVARAAGVS